MINRWVELWRIRKTWAPSNTRTWRQHVFECVMGDISHAIGFPVFNRHVTVRPWLWPKHAWMQRKARKSIEKGER